MAESKKKDVNNAYSYVMCKENKVFGHCPRGARVPRTTDSMYS